MGPAGAAGAVGPVGPAGAPGPAGPKGDPGTGLQMASVEVDLTTNAEVPLATLVPHSWVQTIVLAVDEAPDAAGVGLALLDDGAPLSFDTVGGFRAPPLDLTTAGAVATWPPFLSMEGGQLSLAVTATGGTVGRLRAMVVHGPLSTQP